MKIKRKKVLVSQQSIDLRPNFVSSNNKRNFSTPRVDETGPASVHSYVISISSAKPDW